MVGRHAVEKLVVLFATKGDNILCDIRFISTQTT
jgi:hypothetical protein